MSESTTQPVSVLFYYDSAEQYAHPVRLFWQNREYELGGVQFWYSEHHGSSLIHHYTVGDKDGNFTFNLALETDNLTWVLEQVREAEQEGGDGLFAGYGQVQLAGA